MCCERVPESHTLLDSMPALYTQIRNEPGLTRDAQKLSPKHRRRSPTALPNRYTDHDNSQVPETTAFDFTAVVRVVPPCSSANFYQDYTARQPRRRQPCSHSSPSEPQILLDLSVT
ncbi:hypothetical protein L798_07997 [Zootermopsis nevadensis]|uniref:Uncharacterized protein n=1 Tax=Zootermopsis nevadensis TaxID=136037 RepID=A0A067R4C4_ZOONE|nr:hypothetical protein L798_07997 [Zootermopsis nevadensis]